VLVSIGSSHVQETSAYSKDPCGTGDGPALVDDTDHIVRVAFVFLDAFHTLSTQRDILVELLGEKRVKTRRTNTHKHPVNQFIDEQVRGENAVMESIFPMSETSRIVHWKDNFDVGGSHQHIHQDY